MLILNFTSIYYSSYQAKCNFPHSDRTCLLMLFLAVCSSFQSPSASATTCSDFSLGFAVVQPAVLLESFLNSQKRCPSDRRLLRTLRIRVPEGRPTS